MYPARHTTSRNIPHSGERKEAKLRVCAVVRGLLEKGQREATKRFGRFQRLMTESIAWEPVNSADNKLKQATWNKQQPNQL
jgi:hypothetical protein